MSYLGTFASATALGTSVRPAYVPGLTSFISFNYFGLS